MTDGRAERTLAAIRLLDAETAALSRLGAEQPDWLPQAVAANGHDARPLGAEGGRASVYRRPSPGHAADSLACRGHCHV